MALLGRTTSCSLSVRNRSSFGTCIWRQFDLLTWLSCFEPNWAFLLTDEDRIRIRLDIYCLRANPWRCVLKWRQKPCYQQWWCTEECEEENPREWLHVDRRHKNKLLCHPRINPCLTHVRSPLSPIFSPHFHWNRDFSYFFFSSFAGARGSVREGSKGALYIFQYTLEV